MHSSNYYFSIRAISKKEIKQNEKKLKLREKSVTQKK